jgi:hypothetical protein
MTVDDGYYFMMAKNLAITLRRSGMAPLKNLATLLRTVKWQLFSAPPVRLWVMENTGLHLIQPELVTSV